MKSFTDKEITNVLLNEHKHAATSITNLVLESGNPQLRNDATQVLQNTFRHQKQIFDLMSQKGWYTTDTVSRQEIDKTRQELSSQGQYQG